MGWFFDFNKKFPREEFEIIQCVSGHYILIGPGISRMTIMRFKTRFGAEEWLDKETI